MRERTAEFDVIRQAQTLISGVNASLSDATRAQYCKAFYRMQGRGAKPEEIAHTARSFYFYRAAWVYHYSTEIRQILSLADSAQSAELNQTRQELVSKLPDLTRSLELYRPDPKGKNLASGLVGKWAVEAEKRRNAGQKLHSYTKRVRLRGLPNDWRERMFAGLKAGSKYQDVVAVLSATGARPEEFNAGIAVTLESRDSVETLNFKIGGVKTHGGKYGQDTRSFNVKIDRLELVYLRDRLLESNGALVVTSVAGALSDKVRQLSQKVFPNFKKTVSAYVFRHQFAAELKASGISDAEVSAALGHCVDETKGYYGAAHSARSTHGITNIRYSRAVRELTREKVNQLERGRSKMMERGR
jgi:integrase